MACSCIILGKYCMYNLSIDHLDMYMSWEDLIIGSGLLGKHSTG